MREGRAIRSAAVLMAGLVGAAVIAPGVALADGSAPVPSVASCAAQGEVFDSGSGSCLSPQAYAQAVAARAEARIAAAQAAAKARAAAAQERAQAAAAAAQERAAAIPSIRPSTSDTPGAGTSTATTSTSTTSTGTTSTGTTSTTDDPTDATRPQVSAAEATAALQQLTGANRAGLPVDEALKDLPRGNLDLGDADVPDHPRSGSFTSPKQACLYLASKVSVAAADRGAVGAQFVSFCGALPDSFDPRTGYGTLPDLIAALHELCHGLERTWHRDARADDVDCADFVGDQARAQAVLEADPSDPNDLDRDHDGKACDWNSNDHEVEAASYEGYPQGGVATGDSTPGLAPGAAVALAGLGFATLAGATRRRDDDEERAGHAGDAEDEVPV